MKIGLPFLWGVGPAIEPLKGIVNNEMKRILTLALLAAGLCHAASLRGAENLHLNPRLDYSNDSHDGPLITGDHLEDGAVRGKPNYVFMFGEG